MKTIKLDIHPKLKNVEITVRNGREFLENLTKGTYKMVSFTTNENDLRRIKQFAVRYGNDRHSNRGQWIAHCNGYAMDLCVTRAGEKLFINTYRPYGKIRP